VRLRLSEPVGIEVLAREGDVVAHDGLTVTFKVSADQTAAVAARLLAVLPIQDVAIEQPPMEDVIRAVFAES